MLKVLGFVNKPYRPQDLVAAVRNALDRGRSGTVPQAPENWVI